MMLWRGAPSARDIDLEARARESEGRADVAERRAADLEREVQALLTQLRLMRELMDGHIQRAHRMSAVEGEFLALTREVSGLRTTVTFLNGHLEAVSRERQELLSVLLRARVETPQYEIAMAPPTPGQEAVEGLGRAATAANVGDVLNRLRDQRDGIGLKQAADDLGVFDDLGDPTLPE